MIAARHLFETHLTVADLERSMSFYRDVLGLALAHHAVARRAAFFWVGDPGRSMIGLWAAGPAPQSVSVHTALAVDVADVMVAPRRLREAGITPLDFDLRPTDQPVVFAWMPAAAVFFRDPDGHLLEYIAMLPDEPQPDHGVLTWAMWQLVRFARPAER